MLDKTTNQRSGTATNATANSRPSTGDSPASGAANPRNRTFPTVISGRVQHATKDRAKAVARSRGISMCQLVREAVKDALRTHKKSPDAVKHQG